MLLQIRAVKVKMLNMNEDQLVGTTKLTVIQNVQLTGELEYQSQQTENLMYQNHVMQERITHLQRDLADHKEVEQELAKRSHFCQKVIKKYKEQIQQLQDEIRDLQTSKPRAARKVPDDQTDLKNYLNQRIKTIEGKLVTTQHHMQMQEAEYAKLFAQLVEIRTRYSKAILLLTEFIEHFVEQDPTILQR